MHAETDKHDLGTYLRFGTHLVTTHHEVVLPALAMLLIVHVEDDRCGLDIDLVGEHGHLLVPVAVIAARLKADSGKLLGDVRRCPIVLRTAGHTAHEFVTGEEVKMCLDGVALYRGDASLECDRVG